VKREEVGLFMKYVLKRKSNEGAVADFNSLPPPKFSWCKLSNPGKTSGRTDDLESALNLRRSEYEAPSSVNFDRRH
jgi:hypothetical protein